MEATTVPQVEKREFKNQTNGWLGVVTLDHKGEEKGVSIEPHGTAWLSEAEVILTARAPRLPEDNPFEEQTFIGINEAGQREEFRMRPLVPADTDPRYVPTQERYVPPSPSTPAEAAVHANAAARDQTVTTPEQAAREAAIRAEPPAQGALDASRPQGVAVPAAGSPGPPSTGSQALQGAAAASEADERKSWTEPPPAPGQIISGALRGSNEPPPQAAAQAAPDPTSAPAGAAPPPQPPAPPAPPPAPPMSERELAGEPPSPPAEEHAEAVDLRVGEETGAARPPQGAPVEGEFARAEEVGSPDAPAQQETDTGAK